MATQQFKVGDLVMAKDGKPNGYGYTNDEALMVVSDGLPEGKRRWHHDIKVEVISHNKFKLPIGKVYWVDSKKFEHYRNGVLEWLHKRD